MKPFLLISIVAVACAYADLSNLSLQQAETLALQQNKDILLSEQEMGQFYSRRLQSIAAWFPQITFGSMYTNLQKPQTFLGPLAKSRFITNQFQLNQPLFSTDLFFGMRASKLYWESTKSDRDIAINGTLFQVRTLYYLVVLKEVALKVQEEVIGYLTASLQEEQKKYDAGRAISFEVNQSKVAVSNAVSVYHILLKDLKTARNQLTIALGSDPAMENQIGLNEKTLPIESFPELNEKLLMLQEKTQGLSSKLPGTDLFVRSTHLSLFSEEEIQQWIALARKNRPEVVKSNILVKAAKEQVNYQKGRYLPTISGFIDYGYYLPLNGFFVPQQKNWASGFQLNWNIFDSFKREFQIKEAGFARSAAKISLQQSLDRAAVDVHNQIYQIEEALFSYLAAYEALILSEQSMKEAKVRLIAGTITSLEYRDATRAYSEAHRQNDQTKYSLLQSYFQLRHDTGIDIK